MEMESFATQDDQVGIIADGQQIGTLTVAQAGELAADLIGTLDYIAREVDPVRGAIGATAKAFRSNNADALIAALPALQAALEHKSKDPVARLGAIDAALRNEENK